MAQSYQHHEHQQSLAANHLHPLFSSGHSFVFGCFHPQHSISTKVLNLDLFDHDGVTYKVADLGNACWVERRRGMHWNASTRLERFLKSLV